jgi:hypothetical protein
MVRQCHRVLAALSSNFQTKYLPFVCVGLRKQLLPHLLKTQICNIFTDATFFKDLIFCNNSKDNSAFEWKVQHGFDKKNKFCKN